MGVFIYIYVSIVSLLHNLILKETIQKEFLWNNGTSKPLENMKIDWKLQGGFVIIILFLLMEIGIAVVCHSNLPVGRGNIVQNNGLLGG